MALKKVKTTLTPLFSQDDLSKMGSEYALISKQIKELEATKKALADKIKTCVEQFGVKDDKGSFYYEDENLVLGKVARKSVKLDNNKAVEVLSKKGLNDLIDEITTYEVNEDRLEKAVQDNRITIEEVTEFTKTSVSYSVSVKEKEELPEVEQTSLRAAKSKK